MTSYKARLMHYNKETNKWEMLIPTKGSPALGGDPNLIDASTNEDPMTVNEMGRQELQSLTWTGNYSLETFKKLEALEHKVEHYAQYFGVDGAGSDGMFEFDGILTAYPGESDSYGLLEVTVTIANTTAIKRVEVATSYAAG